MISRRKISLAGGASLLAAHRLGKGQTGAPLRRVACSRYGAEAQSQLTRQAFLQGMRELGWQEGKNVEYRFHYANFDLRRLDAFLSESLAWKAEVIVLGSATEAYAAQRATKTTPIVMAFVSNAVGNGFVASLARPGGNITGSTSQTEEILAKQVELLREVAPRAARVAILLNENNPTQAEYWSVGQRACAALGVTALRIVANTAEQIGPAVQQLVQQGAQAVVVPTEPLFNTERVRLSEALLAARLPAAYGVREHALAGGLLSYGPDIVASHRNAARFVDKILKGAKPADLPVEQPTKFEVVVNKKTAKTLGITIPYSVMLRATEVIE